MTAIGPGSSLLLASDATMQLSEGKLIIETSEVELEVSTLAKPVFDVLERSDGFRTLVDIARELGVPLGPLCLTLEELAAEGVFFDVASCLEAASDAEFLDALFHQCQILARGTYASPFWRTLLGGTAPMSLVFGWGIEFAHFVEAANEYMPLGVAYSRDGSELREAFAKHYVEEAHHSTMFYQGLADSGLNLDRVLRAPPLATTRALINQLNEFAIEGSLTYAASFVVMQPSRKPGDRNQVSAFYASLKRLYPAAIPLFSAMERHALVDIDLGHEATMFEALVRAGGVTITGRQRALEAARTVSECFVVFFEGILHAYGAVNATVPRRSVGVTHR